MTVVNPLYENVYDKQPNTIQLFVIPENSPRLNPKRTFNKELTQHKKIRNILLKLDR
jgi:hypothetical protein